MGQVRTRGERWMKIRARHLRLHPLCCPCLASGVVTEAREVDHKLPLFKGGTDDSDNLQSLCVACHKTKTAIDLDRVVRPEFGLDGWPVS